MEHPWLDTLLVERVSGLFADEWTLEHVETEEAYHEKHGSCIQCTYRFLWHPELQPHQRLFPIEFGPHLMRMIKQSAKGAGAKLVDTRNARGQHDFCDWGRVDGVGYMWVFLDMSEKYVKKRRENRDKNTDDPGQLGPK